MSCCLGLGRGHVGERPKVKLRKRCRTTARVVKHREMPMKMKPKLQMCTLRSPRGLQETGRQNRKICILLEKSVEIKGGGIGIWLKESAGTKMAVGGVKKWFFRIFVEEGVVGGC